MLEKIKAELLKRTNNGTEECTITMKVDNNKIRIVPMTNYGYGEYWLAYGFHRDGFESLTELATYILNYDDEKKAHEEEIATITKYFNEEICNGTGDWDWYSDWHKDVFGFRPHGMVCGQYVNPHVLV